VTTGSKQVIAKIHRPPKKTDTNDAREKARRGSMYANIFERYLSTILSKTGKTFAVLTSLDEEEVGIEENSIMEDDADSKTKKEAKYFLQFFPYIPNVKNIPKEKLGRLGLDLIPLLAAMHQISSEHKKEFESIEAGREQEWLFPTVDELKKSAAELSKDEAYAKLRLDGLISLSEKIINRFNITIENTEEDIVCHRDLHSDNVLVTDTDKGSSIYAIDLDASGLLKISLDTTNFAFDYSLAKDGLFSFDNFNKIVAEYEKHAKYKINLELGLQFVSKRWLDWLAKLLRIAAKKDDKRPKEKKALYVKYAKECLNALQAIDYIVENSLDIKPKSRSRMKL